MQASPAPLFSTPLAKLQQRLIQKEAVIGIYGLGYVGLPLALRFAEVGLRVIGFDIDPAKVSILNAGGSYIERLTPNLIAQARAQGLEATTDFARTQEVDALILCVPTPLNAHREPDLSFIINTIEAALPHMRPGQIVSLESTTWPGTTDEVLAPRMAARGLVPGDHCALVYSPEREDPGNPHYGTRNIPKVIGGSTPACLALGQALYQHAIDQLVPVSSTRAAEMAKLLENIHRSVNIGLVNEMKIVADKMGINIHEVIAAAATKPFGFVAYQPGPGLGGHCIPLDPYYLTWKAREFDYHTKLIETSGEINNYMPYYVVERASRVLNRSKKALNGSKVLILGVAYKNDIDDYRESPALKVIDIFKKEGAQIEYFDPYITEYKFKGEKHQGLAELPMDKVSEYDLVVITTAHQVMDYGVINEKAQAILDTRNAMAKITDRTKIDLL